MGYGVLLQHRSHDNSIDFEMLIESDAQWQHIKALELQLAAHHQTITVANVAALGIMTRLPGEQTWHSGTQRNN